MKWQRASCHFAGKAGDYFRFHSQPRSCASVAPESRLAKTAYKDFLTLWKDADSDIPILKQAKAEYAKLE